jgi:hypothetical protein
MEARMPKGVYVRSRGVIPTKTLANVYGISRSMVCTVQLEQTKRQEAALSKGAQ